MWGTVLLMAVVAGADPVRLGTVALMLTRTKPMRLLLGYFVGGFGLNFIIGGRHSASASGSVAVVG